MKIFHLQTLFILALILSFNNSIAQTNYTGTVFSSENTPLPYANVIALSLPDSAFISGTTTGENGTFQISLKAEAGLFQIASLGYADQYIAINPGQTNYSITLDNSNFQLDEVIVTGKKVLYELKQDRMVMNVSASSAMSGNTALQVLQKAPGVIVNQQSNSISMNAKGEVMVMINNRIQRMPRAVLIAQLQSMPAENIERIEIIHQPSARYDASGAAGIIHIVLKKNDREGSNGLLALMAGYGQKEKYSANISWNTLRRKMNWYGGANFSQDRNDQYEVNHYREYDFQNDDYYFENFVTIEDQSIQQYSANIGLDIEWNKNSTMGFLFSYADFENDMKANSQSNDFFNEELDDNYSFSLFPKTNTKSFFGNMNWLQQLNEQSSLNIDLDYASLNFENIGDLESIQNDTLQRIRATRNTPIDIWTIKADYTNELNPSTKMEFGVKGTFSDIISDAIIENQFDSEWIGDALFSGKDIITERILATYLSFSKNLTSQLEGEVGLRYEYFNYQLDAAIETNDVDQVFNNLFPIARLNYKLDSLNTLQFAFNRTINRPAFNSLSAYFIFLDPSLLVFSNPQLKPAFTNTYKISYQHKSIILSLAYIKTVNRVYYFNTVDKENHLQTSTPTNLDLSNIIEANLNFPVNIGDWWELNCGLGALYQKVEDESSRDLPFERDIYTYTAQLNSTFRFGNDWSISFDGRYMSDFLTGDQVQYLYPYINFGVRKRFSSGSTLSLAFQDITNSIGQIDWDYNQPDLGIRTYGDNNFSERQVRLTYSLKFGNQKVSKKRNRGTGSDEIKSRM